MSTGKNITKLNLYVNEEQYRKLCVLAERKGVEPEQIANEAVYGYLAIVDPYAIDYDDMTPEQQEEYDAQFDDSELYDPLDPCVEFDENGHRI